MAEILKIDNRSKRRKEGKTGKTGLRRSSPALQAPALCFTLALAALSALPACGGRLGARRLEDVNVPGRKELKSFAQIVQLLSARSDAEVFEGDGDSRVLVSPKLQGRIVTVKVGGVESTGFVNAEAIAAGEVDPQFNNFGGVDRFWVGPEAGQFGLYFPPGSQFNRQTWKVPDALDRGSFKVVGRLPGKVLMSRDMELVNYMGQRFKIHVDREVGVLKAASLPADLGVDLPVGVYYAGAYSVNRLTNDGATRWDVTKGLVGVWILGQFEPSDSTVVIAPFRAGDEDVLGPEFNDDYFGKVSVEAPERLKVLYNAAVFRADSRRVGKFGINQRRTTGLAGAMDFNRNLLTIVKFDVPTVPERYGNFTWVQDQAEPFKGDVFQSYNNGGEKPGELAAAPFFELESTSPVRPLSPGEHIDHRHATHHFQGEYEGLAMLARKLLGVNLTAVKQAMLK